MHGEWDESHCLSEYFGSSGWRRRPGAVSRCPGSNPKRYSLPVSGVACSGSAAAIPAPSFGSCGGGLQLAACSVGERDWKENGVKSMARANSVKRLAAERR